VSIRRRVAIDARALQYDPLAGVGRYLDNLLPTLTARADVELFTKAAAPPPARTHGALVRPLRVPLTSMTLPWMQLAIPRALRGYDGIFHGTFNVLPYRRSVPMVVTIHDLSFEHHPHLFPKRANMLAFRYQARHAARIAAAILTVSEFVRDEIIATYAVESDRVLVAPNAVAATFGQLPADVVHEHVARAGFVGRYALAFGGAPRRRLDVSLEAWRRVRAAGYDLGLVVIGEPALPPEPGLVVAGSCPDEEYQALLTGASVFIYPTEYEGYGLLAMEALAAGTPLLCAPVASLPEVAGDAAEWCDEISGEAFAAALARLLDDPGHAAALAAAGRARAAAAPSWAESAEVVLRAYDIAALSE
jgi:alpha-1,3-rhamnosyl/mannosyltransferase